jgi:hypothetical protein
MRDTFVAIPCVQMLASVRRGFNVVTSTSTWCDQDSQPFRDHQGPLATTERLSI